MPRHRWWAARRRLCTPPGWHREVPPLRGRWWMEPDPAAMAMGQSRRVESRRDGSTRPLAGQFGSSRGADPSATRANYREASPGEAVAGGRRRLRLNRVTGRPRGGSPSGDARHPLPSGLRNGRGCAPPTHAPVPLAVCQNGNVAAAPSFPLLADRLPSDGTGIPGCSPPRRSTQRGSVVNSAPAPAPWARSPSPGCDRRRAGRRMRRGR